MLGPLVVVDDAASVLPSGRVALALSLLVEAFPRAVSADRLVAEVWSEGSGSRAALQVLVHRLRKRLGAERLVLEPAGYRLVVAAEDVDAAVFETEVCAARELLGHDPEGALARLEDALGRWRGTPFSGLGGGNEVLAVATSRLEELHAEAVEARFAAALALGRSSDLVGDLRTAVAEAPLRERLHGHLMLALYRSGRTAEALDAYRAARATLVEELGIEPGPELRDLEHAILVEDPVLAAVPPPLAGRGAPARPVQIPPRDPAFVGRETERAQLVAALAGGAGVVAIDGPGGVGKSALALEVAHDAADRYDGGVLYVNLHGATPGTAPHDPAVVLERFLRSLGSDADGRGLEELASQFRSATGARPVLVVLDDAASAAQVRPLLPGAGSAALVTSRSVLANLTPDALHIDVLGEGSALAMLTRFVGRQRVAAEPDAADGILRACGYLPLAIRVVGARWSAAPRRSLSTMLDRLADSRARLDELEADDLAVRSSLEVGLDVAGDEAEHVFAHLGVVSLPHATAAAAARLADLPLGVTRRRLDDLAAAQLLAVDEDERYTMHDLVRLVAVERGARLTAREREAAVVRLTEHAVASARNAARAGGTSLWSAREEIGPPIDAGEALAVTFTDRAAADEWVRAELRTFLALSEALHQVPAGRIRRAALVAPLHLTIRNQALDGEAAPLYEPFLEEGAEPSAADAIVLVDAASGMDHARKYEYSVRAEAIARAVGEPQLVANALNQQGLALWRLQRLDEALAQLETALAVLIEDGDLTHVPTVRVNSAVVLMDLHRYDEAIAVLELDLSTLDEASRANHLVNIATSHQLAGRPDRAAEIFAQSVPALREAGYVLQAALYEWNHAVALKELGRHEEETAKRWDVLRTAVELGVMTDDEAQEVMAGDPPEDLDWFERL
ncbi:transcriptional regulator, SARP family [Beutenbergia cavernae DSM 12333]|uniref:Transcriptional regulator, SARP family n=1 Tax=Beutenbergia cavernae (strain ATCC BAA-8 / DSM 12333 / CCUG 43141 / JCM 11478 / NBRC 16432 / NCIMB 13614 / HKI 0122) TaxID=471853 RepID=C5C013_BEUC1|nr:transcriptional regulator, SARP family [Beutenbergia cavernae DSM 12333]